jgi:hypothetical protein
LKPDSTSQSLEPLEGHENKEITLADKIPEKAIVVANVFMTAIGVISLGAWTYSIYYYVWTGVRQFGSAFDIVLFICCPPVVASLVFASLRLNAVARVGLAMFCLSTVASLYAAEVLLRLFPSLLGIALRPATTTSVDGASEERKNEIRRLAEKFGVKFDTRDRIEVLIDAQTRGIDAVPAVYPSALLEPQQGGSLKSIIRIKGAEVLPLGGISNKTSVLCNETGDYIFYQSDEHGFHNPKGLWKSDRVDLTVLGDSFAHGFCVPSDKHFIAFIREHYPATLSLGLGGNGPLLELATLKEFLPSLRPKIILWVYFEKNDLIELRDETRAPLLLQYLKPDFRQGLISRQGEIDQALLAYVEKEKSRAVRRMHETNNRRQMTDYKKFAETAKLSAVRSTLGLVSIQETQQKQGAGADQAAGMALFRAVLLQAKITAETWGGSLYFLYLPQWERYALPSVKQNREQVLEIVANLKIPVIDLHGAFESHGHPLSLFPFRRSGHYNTDGNRLLAETVLKRLAN